MMDLGRAISIYIGGMIVTGIVGGIAIGVTLAFAVPWLWRFIADHVLIH